MNPREEIRDLGARLYYCSDSGEGRKVRRMIERRIRELERAIESEESTKEFLERGKRTTMGGRVLPSECNECGGPLVYGETRGICARCEIMNDAQNNPEEAR